MQKGKRSYGECPACGKRISYKIDWKAKTKLFRPHGPCPGPCQFVWVDLESGRFRTLLSLYEHNSKARAIITAKWASEKKRRK